MRKFTSVSSLLFLTLTLSALSGGCGLTKNLDEMHDSTGEMAKTTSEMNTKMDKMGLLVEQMVEMKGDIKGLRGDMGEMKTSIVGMADNMTTMVELMGKMDELNEAMQEVRGKMGGMVTVLSSVDSKMGAMDKMKSSLDQMNSLMDRVEGIMGSMDKKMDELPKVTGEMRDLSGKITDMKGEMVGLHKDINDMSGKLDNGKLASAIDRLESNISKLNLDLRAAVGQSVRSASIDSLKKDGQIGDKFAAAAAYVQAFDFQSNREGQDGEQVSDEELRAGSMKVFLTEMGSRIHGNFEFSIIDLLFGGNDEKTLLAVAAAMDLKFINKIKSLELAKDKTGKSPDEFLSIEGMIREALRVGKTPGATKNRWIEEVLRQEPIALYLLQVRANILPAVTLSNLADLPQNPEFIGSGDGLVGKFWQASRGWNRLKMLKALWDKSGDPWTAKLRGGSVEYMREAHDLLKKGLDVKDFLERLGYSAQITPMMKDVFKNCSLPKVPAGSDPEREKLTATFQQDIRKFAK